MPSQETPCALIDIDINKKAVPEFNRPRIAGQCASPAWNRMPCTSVAVRDVVSRAMGARLRDAAQQQGWPGCYSPVISLRTGKITGNSFIFFLFSGDFPIF
jgi:hypothetical protein